MSHPEYLAPRAEITELICILKVVRYAVFVVIFPIYSIIFTPTLIRSLVVSSLCGLTSTITSEYVTLDPTGILLRAKKWIVFVPFLLFISIRLQVVQILMKICSNRGLVFIFLLISLYICNVGCPLCLDQ